MVEEALQKPGFERLSQPEQFRAILLASEAAQRPRGLSCRARIHGVATGFPGAKAGQWVMRAQIGLVDRQLGGCGTRDQDRGEGLAGGPAGYRSRDHPWTAVKMSRDKKLAADRLELLNALFAAKFQLEWHIRAHRTVA